jgi:hypothetical protein
MQHARGHDFQPDCLKLVVQMIGPDTQSLLLYDDAQNLYGNPKNRSSALRAWAFKRKGERLSSR